MIEVAEGHTYFVEDGQGDQSAIWVHNDCALGKTLNAVAGSDAAKLEKMHLLPQAKKFASIFKSAGLDIEEYTIMLEKGSHRLKAFNGAHTGKGVNNWNGAWKEFLTRPRGKDEILAKLNDLRELFGI